MSSRRDKLLAGITSINRREFDARKDSEETKTDVREVLEASAGKRRAGVPSDPPNSLQADSYYQQGDENSLEGIMRAEVSSRGSALKEVELAIATSRERTKRLETLAEKLRYDIQVAQEVLSGYDKGETSTESPVPEEEPGVEDETEESS